VLAIGLALGTSLCYGIANYLGPLQTRRLPLGAVLVGNAGTALLVSIGLVLVAGEALPDTGAIAVGLAAGVANLAGLILYFRAAALGSLSIAAPIGATGAVIPVAVGLASGERPSLLQLAGIPLAVAGVALAARPAGGSARAPVPGARLSVVLALLAAVAFGAFLALFAEASSSGVAWAVLLSRVAIVSLLLVGLGVAGQAITLPPRQLPGVALAGLLLVVGTTLFAEASTRGLLSLVSVIATLFPIVTVTLALVLLGERLGRVQAFGVVGALAGVALIAGG